MDQIQKIWRRTIVALPGGTLTAGQIKDDPAKRVIFEDLADCGLVFDAFFWSNVSRERELRQVCSNGRFRIAELSETNGIVIAFPQRDVHLDASKPLPVTLVQQDDDNVGS